MAGVDGLRSLLGELVDEGAVGVLAELRDDGVTWRLSSGVAELGTDRPVERRCAGSRTSRPAPPAPTTTPDTCCSAC
ncbi:hypothetical protein [Actinoplanes flavus]|uniref:hypothetical protein n=1 Tax=Actinoplanes flavus TaxID=2820290 RepID=UPI0027DD4FC4|nr:hypothetical protein [Actinoplanes flavus]